MDQLNFRPFNKEDIHKCSLFTADAWPEASVLVSEKDIVKFMSADVELAILTSTWLEVACISDRVVGFLFGRINADYHTIARIKAFLSGLLIGAKIVLGRYGKISRPFTFLGKYIAAYAKAKRNSPTSDAEVECFIVDAEFRGKGIGRALMDRFVGVAKKKKAKTIALCTDELSNWSFYEKYGFKRYKAFTDDLSSYVMNKNIQGYVYVMELSS